MKRFLRLKKISFLLLLTAFAGSCAKPELNPDLDCSLSEVYLYGEYTYYSGQNPTFTINSTLTSEYISYGDVSIDPNFVYNTENRVKISIPDITIQKDGIGYNVDTSAILAEEYINGNWIVQSEFQKLPETQQKNMAVVLVLDMSTSLGSDVEVLKTSAINFAEDFIERTDGQGKLGLVFFSTEIETYDFSSNIGTISNRISNYNNYQNATSLLGAMDTALYMLENTSLVVDGKACITFTDGNDNNTSSPTAVKNDIQNSTIPRYMIGLYGKSSDYSEDVLKGLASDESKFVNAQNSSELQGKFDDILDKITNIILLQYLRTTQQFDQGVDPPIEIRFKFTLK